MATKFEYHCSFTTLSKLKLNHYNLKKKRYRNNFDDQVYKVKYDIYIYILKILSEFING